MVGEGAVTDLADSAGRGDLSLVGDICLSGPLVARLGRDLVPRDDDRFHAAKWRLRGLGHIDTKDRECRHLRVPENLCR